MRYKMNKNRYANESQEWTILREKIKDILLNNKTIGRAVNHLMYLVQDEMNKNNKEKVSNV